MASSLNLKIDALYEDGWPALDVKLATTLNDILQPHSDIAIHDAVRSILAHMPGDATYSLGAWILAERVVDVAAQIPYQHPSQGRLVRILKYLTQSPDVVGQWIADGEVNMFTDFTALSHSLREKLLGPVAQETPREWVNYHAFVAQLEAAGVLGVRMPTYAVWEMRDAFEKDLGADSQDRELHQYRVMAAAQWILWDGQEIFKYMANPLSDDDLDVDAWRLEDTDTVPSVPAFSVARWRLWKEGFMAAGAEGGDGSQECRDLAGRAAALMDAIEKSMSF